MLAERSSKKRSTSATSAQPFPAASCSDKESCDSLERFARTGATRHRAHFCSKVLCSRLHRRQTVQGTMASPKSVSSAVEPPKARLCLMHGMGGPCCGCAPVLKRHHNGPARRCWSAGWSAAPMGSIPILIIAWHCTMNCCIPASCCDMDKY